MSVQPLPRLLDAKQLAQELNVKAATAERIMRNVPVISIGRRNYVTDAAVRDYLKAEAKT